jgi:hypothetical protein
LKTEIFAVDSQAGKPGVIFSDTGADFLLLPTYTGSGQGQVIAAAGGRIFARGIERKHYTGGWPTFPAAVYELATDGSNAARKLFDIEGEHGSSNFRDLFGNPSGSKVGHLNYLGGKLYLLLHETAAGALLQKIDLSRIALDCFVSKIGWMPDGKRIFFTLETGDVHVTSEPSYARVGSYMMEDDGGTPARIPGQVAFHPKRPGYRFDSESPPVLLGALPDAHYLFREVQWSQAAGRPPQALSFLFSVDPVTKAWKDFPTSPEGTLTSFCLSYSGAVAFIDLQRQNGVETHTVWSMELESAKKQKVFSLSTRPPTLPWLNLIGWLRSGKQDRVHDRQTTFPATDDRPVRDVCRISARPAGMAAPWAQLYPGYHAGTKITGSESLIWRSYSRVRGCTPALSCIELLRSLRPSGNRTPAAGRSGLWRISAARR